MIITDLLDCSQIVSNYEYLKEFPAFSEQSLIIYFSEKCK